MAQKPVRDLAMEAAGRGRALKHFRLSEFACKCGCGRLKIDGDLVAILDRARDISGVPYVITSGYRCEQHNQKEGGSPTSSHLAGLAADIAVKDERKRGAVLMGLINAGFRRIGITHGFIHVDIDPAKPGAVWLY